MELWLDTLDTDVICQGKKIGIQGITTNPAILAKAKRPVEKVLSELMTLHDGLIAVQVVGETSDEMVAQGRVLSALSNQVIVKVPVTFEGLKAIRALSELEIATMATTIFEPQQLLMAAQVGAEYAAFYFSKMLDAGFDTKKMIEEMMSIIWNYDYDIRLIAASIRSLKQLKECMRCGVQCATLGDAVFKELIEDHPLTKQACEHFRDAWENAPELGELTDISL